MNKDNINWENYEKSSRKEWLEINLKKSKSGSISYIEDKDKLTNWEVYHSHWEDWLSSCDYWKNWREKINSFQTEKEVSFYTDRLRAFIDFVKDHTRKDICYIEGAKPWDPEKTPKLIEQELKRLENISEEEFNKTDKWKKSLTFKELSAKEMINDPWFNKQIFGSENGKLSQEKLRQNQLEMKNTVSNPNFPIFLIIGGSILTAIGLITALYYKKKKQK